MQHELIQRMNLPILQTHLLTKHGINDHLRINLQLTIWCWTQLWFTRPIATVIMQEQRPFDPRLREVLHSTAATQNIRGVQGPTQKSPLFGKASLPYKGDPVSHKYLEPAL